MAPPPSGRPGRNWAPKRAGGGEHCCCRRVANCCIIGPACARATHWNKLRPEAIPFLPLVRRPASRPARLVGARRKIGAGQLSRPRSGRCMQIWPSSAAANWRQATLLARLQWPTSARRQKAHPRHLSMGRRLVRAGARERPLETHLASGRPARSLADPARAQRRRLQALQVGPKCPRAASHSSAAGNLRRALLSVSLARRSPPSVAKSDLALAGAAH